MNNSSKSFFIIACVLFLGFLPVSATSIVSETTNGIRSVLMVAATNDGMSGTKIDNNSTTHWTPAGSKLSTMTANAWLKYSDVDLKYGIYKIKALVNANGALFSYAYVKIYADYPEGANAIYIGQLKVSNRAGSTVYPLESRFDVHNDFENPISLKGTHDIYFVFTPTAASQPFYVESFELSTYVNPTIHLEAENVITPDNEQTTGTKIAKVTANATDPGYIGNCTENHWIMFPHIDLKWGMVKVRVNAAADGWNYMGRIEIWAGDPSLAASSKVGDLNISGTGGWTAFTQQTSDFYGKGYGVKNIYFLFKPVSGGLGNFDWFEIELNDEKIIRNEADWLSDVSGSPDYPQWRIKVISGTPRVIGNCDAGRWVRYNDVDFKGGATGINIKLSTGSGTIPGDKIEVRLDGPNGILLGALSVQGTGDWGNYTVQHADLNGAAIKDARGVHNLFFVFKGNHAGIANLDWYEITLKQMPYFHYEADWYDGQSGISIINGDPWGAGGCPTCPRTIGSCDDGDWVKYSKIDMQGGAIALNARISRSGIGFNGYIEVWVGHPTTPTNPTDITADKVCIGKLAPTGTSIGSLVTWQTQSCELIGNSVFGADNVGDYGTDWKNSDLYFVFRNGGGICDIDWFEITFESDLRNLYQVSQSGYSDDIITERKDNFNIAYQYKSMANGRIKLADLNSATQQNWSLFTYFKDHLGSTRMVIDNSGAITEAMRYDAYGKVTNLQRSATEKTKDGFTTKEYDTEGGTVNGADGINLDYFGRRYYDPEIGRWTSVDPEGQFFDGYLYCGGNPANRVDPDGTWDMAITTYMRSMFYSWLSNIGIKTAKQIEGSDTRFIAEIGINSKRTLGAISMGVRAGVKGFDGYSTLGVKSQSITIVPKVLGLQFQGSHTKSIGLTYNGDSRASDNNGAKATLNFLTFYGSLGLEHNDNTDGRSIAIDFGIRMTDFIKVGSQTRLGSF